MYGNRDLKPETSVTEELAIIYDGDNGYTASATIFNTDFKNKLTNYDIKVKDPVTGLNTFVYDNVGKANIRGWNLLQRLQLPSPGNSPQTILLQTLVV